MRRMPWINAPWPSETIWKKTASESHATAPACSPLPNVQHRDRVRTRDHRQRAEQRQAERKAAQRRHGASDLSIVLGGQRLGDLAHAAAIDAHLATLRTTSAIEA